MAWLLGNAPARSETAAKVRFGGLAAAVALVLGSGVVVPATGCTTRTVPGEECVGGIINEVGECEPKCDPAKCKPGNVCVENACRLLCDQQADCEVAGPAVRAEGMLSCEPALTDPDADGKQQEVFACVPNGHLPHLTDGHPAGWYGEKCALGEDFACYDPESGVGQLGCPNGLECDPNACEDCELDPVACAGRELCNIGKCASSGDRCIFNTCDPAECTPFQCIGLSLPADASAYCSNTDCTEDAHCPAGFGCGFIRDGREVCGTDGGTFNVCGDAPMGEPCVDPNAAPGAFVESGACLLRRACVEADECHHCESNVDCSIGDGDVCALHVNDSVCLRFCDNNDNCRPDEVCVPYVPVSGKGGGKTCLGAPSVDCDSPADCPDPNDQCVPRNVCAPVSGACNGELLEGQTSKMCMHCVSDEDCSDMPGDGWVCTNLSVTGSALKACTRTCAESSDCPSETVSGKGAGCVTNTDLADHRLFNLCVPLEGSEIAECW